MRNRDGHEVTAVTVWGIDGTITTKEIGKVVKTGIPHRRGTKGSRRAKSGKS